MSRVAYGVLFVAFSSLLAAPYATAQSFDLAGVLEEGALVEVNGTRLSGFYRGAEAWADLDNDGIQDWLTTGLHVETDGNSEFQDRRSLITRLNRLRVTCPAVDPCTIRNTPSEIGPGLVYSDMAVADIDRDGDLDVVVAGAASLEAPYAPVIQLYRNDSGVLVDAEVGLPGVYGASIAWGDVDNDGDPDLVVAGLDAQDVPTTTLYRNDDGVLRPSGQALPDVGFGDAAWADVDVDGDLDLALMGVTPAGAFRTFLLRNEGGRLVDAEADLPDLAFGVLRWSDYDADGDPDLLASGTDLGVFLTNNLTVMLRNDGGTLVPTEAELPPLFYGGAAWGDHNGDGIPDLLLTGFVNATGNAATVFLTNINGTFRQLPVDGYTALPYTYGAVSMFNLNDASLDFSLSGAQPGGRSGPDVLIEQELYVSFLRGSSNARPQPPTGLRAERDGDAVTFRWDAAVDSETPSEGLTYALRVGSAPLGSDVLAADANPVTGRRLVSSGGNVGSNLAWTVRGLGELPYYWSVQAIDAAGGASPFAPEQVAPFGDPDDQTPPSAPTGLRAEASDGRVTLTWDPSPEPDVAAFVIVRSTRPEPVEPFGFLAAPATGFVDDEVVNELTYYYRIRAVDGAGNVSGFSEEAQATPTAPLQPHATGLIRVAEGELAWGDVDGDGDHDLAVVGTFQSTPVTRIYRNEGRGAATANPRWLFEPSDIDLEGVRDGALAWADVDGDGDLDLAITGQGDRQTGTWIYRNDGPRDTPDADSLFVEVASGLPGGTGGTLAWGDADNDGDLDLAGIGQDGAAGRVWLLRNDAGTFVDATPPSWEGRLLGTLAWIDLDGDGDLDLTTAGIDAGGQERLDVYLNTEAGFEVATDLGLPAAIDRSLAWGDYDADGDPDLALVEPTSGGDTPFALRLYRNDGGRFTFVPDALQGTSRFRVLAPGDYDNDGDLDLLAGAASGSAILLNDGSGTFATSDALVVGVVDDLAAWGQLDDDDDLDFALMNQVGGLAYRVDIRPGNTPPQAPTGLRAEVEGSTVTLRWDAASDAQTPSPALTYALRVGTAPGGTDVVAPQSRADGRRLVPGPGGAGLGTTWTLRGLAPGTYTWSVQAVDASYAGSPFAPEQTFVVPE